MELGFDFSAKTGGSTTKCNGKKRNYGGVCNMLQMIWSNTWVTKRKNANDGDVADNESCPKIKSKYHIQKSGGFKFLAYLTNTPEERIQREYERKNPKTPLHRCILKQTRTLTDACLRQMSANHIKGVMWVEYDWCGTRLFIGSTYWPPLRSKEEDRVRRNNTLPQIQGAN